MKIFGPDHVPNYKDVVRATKNIGHSGSNQVDEAKYME